VGESGAWTRASKVLEQLTANNSTRLGSSTLDYPVKNVLRSHTDISVGESGAWTRASKVLEQLTANNSTQLGSSTLDYPVKNVLSDRRMKLPPVRQCPNRLQNVSFPPLVLGPVGNRIIGKQVSLVSSTKQDIPNTFMTSSLPTVVSPYGDRCQVSVQQYNTRNTQLPLLNIPNTFMTLSCATVVSPYSDRCQYNNTIHEILSYRRRFPPRSTFSNFPSFHTISYAATPSTASSHTNLVNRRICPHLGVSSRPHCGISRRFARRFLSWWRRRRRETGQFGCEL
jgi:hypothetical protein